MNWDEFKEVVDKKLKERGIDPKTEIWFIDVSYPMADDFEKEYIGVGFRERQGIMIC